MSTTAPTGPQDIASLKQEWLKDPCWDIEDAPGFEAQREELLHFRTDQEAKWKTEYEAKRQQELGALAVELGVPGNLILAAEIERLRTRITELENRLGGD